MRSLLAALAALASAHAVAGPNTVGANGTISLLNATYDGNCNAWLAGDVTAAVAAACNGKESCAYQLCICGYDHCTEALNPCVPDPAQTCAKDFSVRWHCSGEAPGVDRSAYMPAEADLSVLNLTCGPPPRTFSPADITVAAFVYDPWTAEEAVFGVHGPNWTEWELVRRAQPRFPGHLQPKVPLWNEVDTSLPATWDLLNAAARSAGIEVYLWDWYWWADAPSNPLLVRGLHDGFLQSASASTMKWAVMWANQDWNDLMPAKRKAPLVPTFHGATNASVFKELSQYWIDHYFSLDNYFRVPQAPGGTPCPLASIYQLDVLVQALGGVDAAAAAMADLRARAAAAGLPCVHIMTMMFNARDLPAPIGATLKAIGVDSATDYCPQHYESMDSFPLVNYSEYSSSYVSRFGELAAQVAPVPYAPNFGVAWDPSPRTVQSDAFDNWGYPATPVLQPTLDDFRAAVTLAADAVAARCTESWCLMTVYAYTEFSEGGSLWPTVIDGFGRLDAFTDTFGNRSAASGLLRGME
jgi:hypothetical protein